MPKPNPKPARRPAANADRQAAKPKTREDAVRELVEKDPARAAKLLRDFLANK